MKKLIKFIIFVIIIALAVKGFFYLKEKDLLPKFNLGNNTSEVNNNTSNNPDNKTNSNTNNSNNNNTNNNENKNTYNPDLTGIPEDWINMFKFDNVTIECTTVTIGTMITYTYYDKGVAYSFEGDTLVESKLNPQQFDYTAYYKDFTYDESYRTYTASNIYRSFDDEYPRNVQIVVDEGRIYHIYVETIASPSLSFSTEYRFFDYDTTNLDDITKGE